MYAILFSQLALTGVVSTWVVLDEAPRRALTQNPVLFWLMLLSPLLLMIPLFMMRQRHPHNLILLGVWTLAQSLSIGVICSAYPLPVLAEAIVLTAAVCGGLTSYTFYAIRKGHDFSYLGQILFGGLLALLLWGFVQVLPLPSPLPPLPPPCGAPHRPSHAWRRCSSRCHPLCTPCSRCSGPASSPPTSCTTLAN